MDAICISLNLVIGLGSFLMLIAPFATNFRGAPRWMHSVMFGAGVLGLARAAVGIYVETLYAADAFAARLSIYESVRFCLSVVTVTLLLILFVTREFRDRGRSIVRRKV